MSNNTTKLRQQLRSNFLQLCSYKIRQKLCVKEYHKRNTQIFIYVTQLVLPLNIVVLQLGRKISVLIGHYINFYLCFVHCSVCKIMRIVKYFFCLPLIFIIFPFVLLAFAMNRFRISSTSDFAGRPCPARASICSSQSDDLAGQTCGPHEVQDMRE